MEAENQPHLTQNQTFANKANTDALTSTAADSDDTAANLTFAAKFNDCLFNLLFLIVNDNNPNPVLEYLSFIIEDLQIISYAFTGRLMITLMPHWLVVVLNVFDFHGGDSYSYSKYKVIFGLCAAAVFLLVALLSYVFHGCWNGNYEFTREIKIIRFLLILMTTMLFIPTLSTLLTGTDCTYYSDSVIVAEFPNDNVDCFSDNLPILIIGIFSSICFTVISLISNQFVYESNPTLKRPTAKTHGNVSVVYTVLKVILVLLWKFGFHSMAAPGSLNAVLITATTVAFSMYLCYLMLLNYPFYSQNINHVRFALYFTAVAANLVAFLSNLGAYFDTFDESTATFSVIIAMLLPAFFGGYYISLAYFNRVNAIIDGKLQTYDSLGESKERLRILVYSRWQLVEISTRFITKDTNERVHFMNVEKDWEPFVKRFSHGMKEFPQHHMLTLAYANYLSTFSSPIMTETMSSSIMAKQELTVLLMKAMKAVNAVKLDSPSSDVAFKIFYMERAVSQRREGDEMQDGMKLDAASFADFRKKEKIAIARHQDVIKNLMRAWRLIITKDYDSQQLATYCKGAYEANTLANEAYSELVRKFPRSQNILRQYAKFLLDVGNQPYRAKMILMRAEALEEESGKDKGAIQHEKQTQAIKGAAKLGEQEDPNATGLTDNALKNLRKAESGSVHSDDDRKSDHKSDLSGSSTGTNMELRAENALKTTRMRLTDRLNKMVDWLNINNIIIMLITITIIGINYGVVSNTLKAIGEDLQYLHELLNREFLTAYEFRSVRQMEQAIRNGDEHLYKFYRKRLNHTLSEIPVVNRYLFENRLKDNPLVSSVYTTRSSNASFSAYPSMEEAQIRQVTVYDYFDIYAQSGLNLVNYEFGEFGVNETGEKWLSENNDFRFIIDNLENVQIVYGQAVTAFEHVAGQTASNEEIAYVLTGIQLGSVFFLLIIVDFLVSNFYNRQGSSLNLFRLIPTKKVKEILNAMNEDLNGAEGNEAGAQGGNAASTFVDDGALEDNSGWLTGVNRFRIRYVIFFIILSILSVIFSIFNGTNIYFLGQQFSIITACGDMRSLGTVAEALVTEIKVQDMKAWGDDEKLREYFLEVAEETHVAHGYFLFGDITTEPPGYSLDEMSDTLKHKLIGKSCLTKNHSLCEDESRYDSMVGLTEEVLHQSLEIVSRITINILNTMKIQAREEFEPDESQMKFLKEVFDNDYVDGLEEFMVTLIEEAELLDHTVEKDNIIQLVVILAFIVISYFAVFMYISTELRNRNYQIAELFLYLPQELVKNIPEIANYLRTGEIDKHTMDMINSLKVKNKLAGLNKHGDDKKKKDDEEEESNDK